jgi:hypothetical protein
MGKVIDKNDFWFIEKNPITKVGVYPYLGKQISQDCEPNKIYYVLRPKEELFRKETLDSLRLIPLIDGHTMIGKDFTAPEKKGIDGTLGDNVSHDTDTIYNDLKIISNKMKDEIKNGKKELSLGYFCRYDKQPGIYKGQRYDYVQRDIIANHLALVDKGRMGADVRVYDSMNIPEGEAFAMDSIDITMDKDEDIEWITVKGTHIPIKKGENKEQAVKKFLEGKRNGGEQSSGEKELDKEKLSKMKDLLDKTGGDYEFAKSQMKSNEDVDKMIGNLEKEVKKQEAKMNAPEKVLPKTFEKGDIMHSKKLNRNYVYLGKNKDGLYMFVDNDKFIKNDISPDDMWAISEKYLKNNLADGNMTLAENRSGYEKSEPEQAGKKKKEATDSMEYKTIQGEGKMEKEKKVAIDEDKRKLIDEIGGILKGKVDEELWKTIIGKAEKLAYNGSEAGKGTDEGEEVEEKEKEVVEEGKDKKAAKDKCGKDEEKDEEAKKKEIVKEFAKKEKLAKEVEDELGTFDHSEMTELEVAKYACDKLELGAAEGQELATLKGYLKGVAKAPKATYGYKKVAQDSGITKDEEFEKFTKGE